jgi:hypothetical protein
MQKQFFLPLMRSRLQILPGNRHYGFRCPYGAIDPAREICIMLPHPSDKNKGVARVGHPNSVAIHKDRINKTAQYMTYPPPPVFWTQNPLFLEVTDMVALQNSHNKGVARKIVQDKELAAPFGNL